MYEYFSQNGQTALAIAQKLGYISVVETLKIVTETIITTTHTVTIEEKYRVQAPESMQETFMSDSEDEGGKCLFLLCYKLFLTIFFLDVTILLFFLIQSSKFSMKSNDSRMSLYYKRLRSIDNFLV